MSASAGPTHDGEDRVDALEAQVRALQEEVKALRRAVEGEPAGAGEAAVSAPPAAATPARATLADPAPPAEPVPDRAGSQARKPRAAWRDLDLEALIGGRWLNWIGILTLLIAAGFFLRYAFENEWIGPTGRVLIGLVSGVVLGIYGEWLAARGMRYFSEGMTALGVGVVYLSGYAAWGFYALAPQPAAFAFLALVTAAVIGLSVRRDSQRLAALALAGGYLTPALLSTGEDAQIVLFSYLALLSASLLALALLRGFQALAPVALIATVGYFIAWSVQFYDAGRLVSTALFGTLFFAIFTALPLARARLARRLRAGEVGVLVVALGFYVVLLQSLLYEAHRFILTAAVLALAALYFALSRALGSPAAAAEGGRQRRLRALLAVQAALLATIAFPIQLDGEWITIAWTAEAVALAIAGARLASLWMRVFSAALFAVVLLMAPQALLGPPDGLLFVNLRFLTLAGIAVGIAVAGFHVLRHLKVKASLERPLWATGPVIANVLGLVAVSLEAWDFVQGFDLDLDLYLAAQVVLSALWLVWAAALVAAGIRRDAVALRWQGLALLLVVVGKTFLVDLSFLDQGYRILSFLIVGALLVAVSFLYQRRRRADAPVE